MPDLSRVAGFEWDAGNEPKSTTRHGVTQGEAEQVFMNEPLIVAADPQHSSAEQRFHALGRTSEGRTLHVTLRAEGTLIRVISARDMHRKERAIYEEAP